MYVINLTTGSVLLPSGRDLVTWIEVDKEEAESLRKYEGTLLSISATKPLDLKVEPKQLPIEKPMAEEGTTSLAEALKPTAVPVETPEEEVVVVEPVTEKKSKKSGK